MVKSDVTETRTTVNKKSIYAKSVVLNNATFYNWRWSRTL